MTLSLIAYVSFEVLQGWVLSTMVVGLAEQANQVAPKNSRFAGMWLIKAWRAVFLFCVVTGFGGGLFILYAYLHSLVKTLK